MEYNERYEYSGGAYLFFTLDDKSLKYQVTQYISFSLSLESLATTAFRATLGFHRSAYQNIIRNAIYITYIFRLNFGAPLDLQTYEQLLPLKQSDS